jgi:hypothetical protein
MRHDSVPAIVEVPYGITRGQGQCRSFESSWVIEERHKVCLVTIALYNHLSSHITANVQQDIHLVPRPYVHVPGIPPTNQKVLKIPVSTPRYAGCAISDAYAGPAVDVMATPNPRTKRPPIKPPRFWHVAWIFKMEGQSQRSSLV